MQNVAVLWSDEGVIRTSVLNVLDFSWQHIQLYSSVDINYRLGAAILPKFVDQPSNNSVKSGDQKDLAVESVLILGGLSITDNDERLSVCELKFTNSDKAPFQSQAGGVKVEELKEQVQP